MAFRGVFGLDGSQLQGTTVCMRTLATLTLLTLSFGSVSLFACSGGSNSSSGGPVGTATATATASATATATGTATAPVEDEPIDPGEVRPDVPGGPAAEYPAGPYGTGARVGTRRGDTLKNMTFSGYPDGKLASGRKTFSWAGVYDKTGKTRKMMHVQVAGVWCSFCKVEQGIVAEKYEEWKNKGIVWSTIVVEGKAPGAPAVDGDLNEWFTITKPNNPVGVDPGRTTLSGFVREGGLPFGMWVDLRNMEIIKSGEGACTTVQTCDEDVNRQLAAFETRTP
jgi:hypothetical protein